MTTEILSISGSSPTSAVKPPRLDHPLEVVQNLETAQARIEETAKATLEETRRDMELALNELETLSKNLNKRLKFHIDESLDSVVVKVIDPETEKVIKEYPPKELQLVHKRIKEAIGLLFDQMA